MSEVVLRQVTKIYPNGFQALHPLDLEIADGEFVVLVGPSGCGKSTTLRIVAGLEDASAGDVLLGDRVVNEVEPRDRNVAMVFQSYALYPHMSVRDNLAFGLKVRKTPKDEIGKRVEEAAKVLGIDGLLDRKPKQLSGGQRQRVALGRAIVRDPDVFLFDEPLSNLDAKMRVQMRTEIARLHHRLGATMIYVTHDQTEAMTLGQRIVIMNEGAVQQVDTPMELYDCPANRFVAGFIGSPAMNFLRGRIVRDGGMKFVLEKELMPGEQPEILPLPADWRPPESLIDCHVVLGIRPEHVSVSSAAVGDGWFARPVQVIEPLGNETLLYFTVGGGQFVVRGPGGIDARVDGELGLSLMGRHVHLFAEDGGKRLEG